jgi:hypothetical protein
VNEKKWKPNHYETRISHLKKPRSDFASSKKRIEKANKQTKTKKRSGKEGSKDWMKIESCTQFLSSCIPYPTMRSALIVTNIYHFGIALICNPNTTRWVEKIIYASQPEAKFIKVSNSLPGEVDDDHDKEEGERVQDFPLPSQHRCGRFCLGEPLDHPRNGLEREPRITRAVLFAPMDGRDRVPDHPRERERERERMNGNEARKGVGNEARKGVGNEAWKGVGNEAWKGVGNEKSFSSTSW